MRPVKPTILAAAFSVSFVAALAVGCGAKSRSGGVGPTAGAAGDSTGMAGSGSGAAGTGPASGAGAGTGTGAAGTNPDPDPTGAAGTGIMGTIPSGAGGTVDQGHLFTDAAAFSTTEDAGATSQPETGASGDSGKTTPGDGNTSTCHVGGMSFLLVFTQKGSDVTMVVTANNCSAGNHTIQIRGGFSCDNAGTEGGVWDGQRGAGIPMLSCANNKGSLTYTRSGADPTTSWTVGDHNTKTDVTLHPMSVDTSCGTFF